MKCTLHTTELRLAEPLRISRSTTTSRHAVGLSVEHQGLHGHGEVVTSVYYGLDTGTLHQWLRRCFQALARFPDPETALAALTEDGTGAPPAVTAAVESALLDLAGKRAGKPVHRLLGATAPPTAVTARTVGVTTPSRAAALAARLADHGFTVLKVKAGSADPEDDVGTVLGVRNLSQQGLFVIGGSAADRLGARGVIITGCALRTVGFGLFALGDGTAVLLAASVHSGLAGALFNPAVRAYLAQEAGERRAETFALFNVFATTGALVGPLLGSALLLVDFRAAALAAAGLFALLTVAQALMLPAGQVAPAQGHVLADWREVVGNRAFMAFALAMVAMIALESQLYLLLPEGARRATGWDGAAGPVLAVATLAGLGFQLRITRALQRRGSRAGWISGGLALMAAAFVPPMCVTWGPGADPGDVPGVVLRIVPVLVGALLLQTGLMVAQPFVMELVPAFGRSRLTGTYFGVFHMVSGIAAALGNAAVGWAMDTGARTGAGWLPWACCLGLGLASAAAVARLHRVGALPGKPAPVPARA